jgi:glutamate carboxypeptidase
MDPVESRIGLSRSAATERMLERIGRYVTIESPSRGVEALVRLADAVAADAAIAGGEVETFDADGLGRNLRITFPGDTPQIDPLYVLGHLDTVHPRGTIETQPFRIVGDRLEGPGVFDMKSGIAVMLEALALFAEDGRRPRRTVRVLLTCDEEIGSHAARDLFATAAEEAFAALVPEPSMDDGSLKTRRKGVGTYRIDAFGRAAHAGIEPEKAVSAIAELASQIVRVLDLADHARGTTINIGTIEGGTASNVVPAHAWATVDTRFLDPDEGERLDRSLLAIGPVRTGARIESVRTEMRPPLVRTTEIGNLADQAVYLAAGLGVTIDEGTSGGGSDGSLVASLGLPVLDGLGPRGGGAHAIDEHIVLSDLPFRLAFYMSLLETL